MGRYRSEVHSSQRGRRQYVVLHSLTLTEKARRRSMEVEKVEEIAQPQHHDFDDDDDDDDGPPPGYQTILSVPQPQLPQPEPEPEAEPKPEPEPEPDPEPETQPKPEPDLESDTTTAQTPTERLTLTPTTTTTEKVLPSGSLGKLNCEAEIAQMVCGSCRRLLRYPPRARWVQCSCCQTINFVLEAHQVGQVKCGSCMVLLMYPFGASQVRCSSCQFVTEIGALNHRPPWSIQQGQ